MTTSAVAMFAFNRPDKTERVFAAVRAARPPRLLLVCDGPRASVASDAESCAAVRRVVERVDWPCEVERDYADANLGCRARISSGIAWVFSRVDEAIFLEDDTLPDASFFPYCDEMLARYRDDDRVLMVSGHNRLGRGGSDGASYWFSAYPRIWGWASWGRKWADYDVTMSAWPAMKSTPAWQSRNAREQADWAPLFDAVKDGRIDTWDAQVTLMAWQTSRLSAIASANLITNIGFGAGATNTGAATYDEPAARALDFPLQHPARVERDEALDAAWIASDHPPRPSLWQRVARRARRLGGGAG